MWKLILLIVIKVIETIVSHPFQNWVKQVNELMSVIKKALKPDPDGRIRITPEEIQEIVKEAQDVSSATEVLTSYIKDHV